MSYFLQPLGATDVHRFRWPQAYFPQVNTNSRDNDPTSNDVRKISTSFHGSAVFVYGAPKKHLNQDPGISEICMHDQCHIIWGADRYRDAVRDDQPVLLWWAYGLDPAQLQVLEIRFLETDGEGRLGMTLESIEYTAQSSVPSLPHHSAPNTTDRTNVTLHDTNYALQYLPETNRWGIKVRNVWKKYYYLPFLKPDDTFHYTTNYGNEVSGFENRQISFEFKGVALYIYGAPKDELELLVGGDYSHSDIEICIDTSCFPLDNHQTYLNLEGADRHLPVLLWSGDGFSSTEKTHVRIRLTDTRSDAGPAKGFGLERVVYTEIQPKKIIVPTDPELDGSFNKTETVPAGRLNYERGTWRSARSYTGSYNWAENKLVDNHLPRWSFRARAHTMQIFGPPPQAVQGQQLAAAKVCLDEACHYLDVEHIYLGVDNEDRLEEVLLCAFNNLRQSEDHTISMELVDRFYDEQPRLMVVSRLDWTHTLPPFKAPEHHISTGPIILVIIAMALAVFYGPRILRSRKTKGIQPMASGHAQIDYNTFGSTSPAGPPPYSPFPRSR